MFEAGNIDEDELVRLLDDALADAFLLRWYCTKYYAIRAWYGEAEQYIQMAKEELKDMRQVMRVQEKTDMKPLKGVTEAVEGDPTDEDEPNGGIPAPVPMNEAADTTTGDDGAAVGETERAARSAGVKRKRTREVTPAAILPTPPDTVYRRRIQPTRRVKSNQSTTN